MELIFTSDIKEARLFLEEYDISYEIVSPDHGEERLAVHTLPPEEHSWIWEAEKRLRRSHLSHITDHPLLLQDRSGDLIAAFSPYNVFECPKNRPWLEMSRYSVYGSGTTTFVIRRSILEAVRARANEKRMLAGRIRAAKEQVARCEQELQHAKEQLDKLQQQSRNSK